MSFWLSASGTIEIEDDFPFSDLDIKGDNFPRGSEGELSLFTNEHIINKDRNRVLTFTVSGAIRDVETASVFEKWLASLISRHDIMHMLLNVDCQEGEFIYTLSCENKLLTYIKSDTPLSDFCLQKQ